jgi:crotonobetainyl-CoA:carnitine CoA-transferase CaiB-like acyl-CoA transferase
VRPLEGIRVIDFTHFVAGPHCTLWLASLGAEVLKIESPKRPDPFRLSLLKRDAAPTLNNSAVFAATNLMKRSCCIDIAEPEGQQLCHELVAHSDVVVANFRPGVLEQFNMDYDTLCGFNSAIIVATVTGYGYDGDFAAFQALGPNIHAFSGLSAGTGYADGPPEQFFGTYADVLTGQAAALSILAAVIERDATGRGCFVDTAMSEALVAVAPEVALRASVLGENAVRRGNDEDGFAPHGCYPCAGIDRWVAIATFDDAQWQQVATVLGLSNLCDDPLFRSNDARWLNRSALDRMIGESTRSHDAAELAETLSRVGIAAAPVRTAEDVLKDEQLLGNGFIGAVWQSELGEAQLPKLPWRIQAGGAAERPIGPAPDFGEGTRELLRTILDLSEERLQALTDRGVIA